MTKKISIALLFGLLFGTTFAQNINTAKLDSLFQILETKDKFMGSIAVAENGKLLYTKSIGKDDIRMSLKILISGPVVKRRPFIPWLRLISGRTHGIILFGIPGSRLEHVVFAVIAHGENKLGASLILPGGHYIVEWRRSWVYVETCFVASIVLVDVDSVHNRF